MRGLFVLYRQDVGIAQEPRRFRPFARGWVLYMTLYPMERVR